MDKIVGHKINVLDHGFILPVDFMGCDADIAQAARVSYGKGTKTVNEDAGLIRYLIRHRHTTPFEMCEVKFHLKMPIFVARQWHRHRTANINEISARYSIIKDEFYIPELSRMAKQSESNKQGSGKVLEGEVAESCNDIMHDTCINAFANYTKLLDENHLARELSRSILPQSTYTEFYWKIDLHNLLHFLSLRAEEHAQYEIRVYAKAMLDIIKHWVPITYQAFMDYRMNCINLFAGDIEVIKEFMNKDKATEYINANQDSKKGEVRELCEKLKKLTNS